jgi:hypothetical protein
MQLAGTLGFFLNGSLFVRYCMKGNYPKRKLFFGFLLIYWSEHIYHLSSYLGILYNLKCIINK